MVTTFSFRNAQPKPAMLTVTMATLVKYLNVFRPKTFFRQCDTIILSFPPPSFFCIFTKYKLSNITSAVKGNGYGFFYLKKNVSRKMVSCCQISHLCPSHIIIWFIMIFSGLLINKFSYKYSEKRAWNPTIIFWVCGRHFLPAGCLLMWKQAHFTFKSTSVFAWIKFLLQLAKSGWPQGFTNKYVCYVFILLNMEIGKHKNCLLKNKTKHQICPKMKTTTD